MNVAFRVDASSMIGTGHVVRCLTLADQMARRGARCRFIARHLLPDLADRIERSGHRVSLLPDAPESGGDGYQAWLGVDWAVDAEQTATLLTDSRPDWLVVDHYALDARWETALRPYSGRLMVVDDLADRPHDADVVLDQTLQATPDRYAGLVPASCRLLLGPRYALLRDEFKITGSSRQSPDAPPRALVFFGGTDEPGLTLLALKAFERTRGASWEADVVVGISNAHANVIEDWCATRPWARVHSGWANMAALMDAASLAIGAGGTTTWERCALGLPAILVAIAENQCPGSEAVADAGSALYVGTPDGGLEQRLRDAITLMVGNEHLRRHIATVARSLVDGRGTDRVVAAMEIPAVGFKRATSADCESLWRWRNDPATRRHALDPTEIDLMAHRRWFEMALANPDRDLLVAQSDGVDLGVVRFDINGDRALVSIYLVPGHAGGGDGTRVLQAAVAWLRAARPDVLAIDAEILTSNTASLGAFAAAGFTPFKHLYRRNLAAT